MVELFADDAVAGCGKDRKKSICQRDDGVVPFDLPGLGIGILGNKRVEGQDTQGDAEIQHVVKDDVDPEGLTYRNGDKSNGADEEANSERLSSPKRLTLA